jgi:predicted metal-dependent enzyme (double-stranded beta helix superfamily)
MRDDRLAALIAKGKAAVRGENPVAALRTFMTGIARNRDTVLSLLPGDGEPETLLYSSPTLSLLRVELEPGIQYPPHDHRMDAVIAVLDGEECNTFYRPRLLGLDMVGENHTSAGGVVDMTPTVVHAVSNRGTQRSVGLHAYTGEIFGISRTIWDIDSGLKYLYTDERYFALARKVALVHG